jgi:HK97 family phage major capsid protein
MTAEEIKALDYDALTQRIADIKVEMESEDSDIEALSAEVDLIEERKAELKAAASEAAEKRAMIAEKLEADVIEERKEEETKMTNMEMRNTPEYGKAFVKGLLADDFTEARALLTENVTGGSVPVPEILETEIKNAWEDAQFLQFAKRTSYKGNVKVGFEVSATGAAVHVEGANAPTEETLVWGTVELKAESIKKWITVSDEALEGTTIDTLGEIYKEVAQRIVEKAEEIAIGKIIAAPATTSAANGPGVPVLEVTAIAADTIVNAVALLSGKAKDLRIIMNRQTKAAFEAVALGLSYGADIYDGLKDRIIYTDALDAFSAADPDDTFVIIGDIGYGFQANFPAGNDVKIKVDDLSLAEKDLVKIVGRQYVGMGVVAPKAFVKINKVSSEG